MKSALCILMLLICCHVWAQVEEIPELSSAELQDNWLESFYKELGSGKSAIKINSRLRYDAKHLQQFHSLKGSKDGFSITLNASTPTGEDAYANFRLSSLSRGSIKELGIGSFNPAWASGAVFKQNSNKQALFSSGNPMHPEYSSPQGVTLVMGNGKAQAFGIASQAMRPATIKDGLISTLYKKRNPERSHVWEKLIAGGAELSIMRLRLGAMVYYQSYELPFKNTELSKDLHAFSAAAMYAAGKLSLECETAIIGDKPALKGAIGIKHAGFKQQLGISVHSASQLPAYSAKPGVLSYKGEHSELNWNTDYAVSKDLDAYLRVAISRNDGGLSLPEWQSRTIFGLRFDHAETKTGLQLSRINKELVSIADSSYISTLPMHYRLQLSIRHKLSPKLELGTQFRYHYEDKIKQERNSFYWENRIRGTGKYAHAEVGLRNWQSLHSVFIPDAELGDAEGLFVLKGEDSQVYIKLGSRLRRFHMASELRYSLHTHDLHLYLNIGI